MLLGVAASNAWLHDTGLLATGALAALAGADALTLSLARLEADGVVETARRLAPTLLAVAVAGAFLAVFAA